MFYSKSTNGFYATEIHGDAIPSDAVEITTEEHQALLSGQSEGQVISSDASGKPMLTPPAAPTEADLKRLATSEAQNYLFTTDWYVIRKSETGEAIPKDVTDKRAAARITISKA